MLMAFPGVNARTVPLYWVPISVPLLNAALDQLNVNSYYFPSS